MLLIISPSKTQNLEGPSLKEHTLPVFLPETETLVKHLKAIDRKGLKDLMAISDKLADLTWDRFQNFSHSFNLENARQAILTFHGDVFTGIRAEELSLADLRFAQDNLRIISGLYGLLKPLDLIQPYRLEMKTKLKTTSTNDLYEFWGNKITEFLNKDAGQTGNTHLINLASQEYFKAVQPPQLQLPVLDVVFKVRRDDKYKIVAVHAKRARGLMVNFVIKNRLDDINDLKNFREDNYQYKAKLSSELEWVFCKD